jgi:hypothetical protein
MRDNQRGVGSTAIFGTIIGAMIAAALAIFLLSGGEHFGKKTVNGDDDLPPVQMRN